MNQGGPPSDPPTELETEVDSGLSDAGWGADEDSPELDRFQLLRKLGQGGMGQVFLARQTEPVERLVALKLIRSRVQSPTNLARFEVERQALAQMNHLAIAQVFDAGTTTSGQPWFAMEYVDGHRLDVYCREHKLTLDERLALFARICNGVQHAHQRGIIHRDLKPANILVRQVDGTAMPKIIDFGIATASVESGSADNASRDVVGTPQYMSPEQFSLDRQGIDSRSDVYSLGVILYELLTDCLPVEGEQDRSADSQQMQAILSERHTLPGPSTRISASENKAAAIASRRRTSARKLTRQLRGDLDAITLKALAVDRDLRYASVQELVGDIQSARSFRPVSAMPNTARYRMGRFARRHALGLGSASAVLLALIAGLTAATLGMFEAQRQFQIAEQRQQDLAQVAGFQQAMLENIDIQAMGIGLVDGFRSQLGASGRSDEETEALISRLNAPDLARNIIDTHILEQARLSIEADFADQPSLQADLLQTVFEVYQSLGVWERAPALTERILQLRRQTVGEHHLDTYQARQNLANAYFGVGDYDASISRYESLLADLPEDGDEFVSQRIQAMHGLATTLVDSRHTERALEMSEQATEQALALWGEQDKRSLDALAGLAYVRVRSGQLAEALPVFQRVVEGRQQLLGESHPQLIGGMINLGAILGATGNHEEAYDNDQQLLEILTRTHGLRHPSSQRVMTNLAAHMLHLDRTDEAVALLEQALALRQVSLGALHPETLRTVLNLGSALIRLEQYERAVELLDTVYQERSRLLGQEHLDTLMAAELLADVLAKLERHDEALAMIEPVYRIRLERLGPEHRQTADAASYKGRSLLALGQHEHAIELLAMAAELAQAGHPPESPVRLRRSLDYYKALLKLDRQQEAARLRAESLSWLEQSEPGSLSSSQRRMHQELLATESP